jgi:hypothetical protein
MSKANTLYIAFGAMWDAEILQRNFNEALPICVNCRMLLKPTGKYERDGGWLNCPFVCPKCKKEYFFKGYEEKNIEELQFNVYQLFQASLRQNYDVVTLDTPPAKVKANDEDEYYAIWANMTQQKGKRLGLVYMAEKGNKDKVQMFIDLDNQQVRHDPANKHPKELLAKVTVEFNEGTIVTNEYNEELKQ